MLIKFFARGKGKGSGPVEYITRKYDRVTGKLREPAPFVIRGNPEITQQLIDSLDFKHKYNSGVLSFAPEDAPTLLQQQKLIDSFEEYAFAGLKPDQYDILWVRHTHTDSNRVELHFVTPRVELDSGRSLNISPPGWEQYFKPWRDYWNITQEWARPDDSARARAYQPGVMALIAADRARAGLKPLPDPRAQLSEYIVELIEAGQIKNRDDIISEFKQLGLEIPRASENYITVFDPEADKRYRLKGAIYEKNWTVERSNTKEDGIGEDTHTAGDRGAVQKTTNRTREGSAQDLSQIQERIIQSAQRRAKYHNERYGAQQPAIQTILGQPDSMVDSSSRESLSGYLIRKLGDDFIPVKSDSVSTGEIGSSQQRNNCPTTDVGRVREEDQRNNDNQHQQRDIHHSASVQRTERRLAVSGETLSENGVAENERTRTEIDERLQRVSRTIQTGHEQTVSSIQAGYEDAQRAERAASSTSERIEQTIRNLSQTNEDIERANRELNDRLRQIERDLERVRLVTAKRLAKELERFKTNINLVEYARSIGYEYVNTESTRNSAVLRHGNGDKIVVTTDIHGRGIYFSVIDDADNGTIIDFVQQRRGVSGDEVRKELQSWISTEQESTANFQPHPAIDKPLPISYERYQVLKTFFQFQIAQRHPYLEKLGIAVSTLSDERFLGTVKINSKNNAIFPHYDADGLTGFEIKNDNFTSFSRGGIKALWESNKYSGDRRLIITESTIDALSYHQLFPDESTRYISTGDTLSEEQRKSIGRAMLALSRSNGEIIIATTNDSAGNELAESLAKQAFRDRSSIYRHKPEQGQGWNEVLQHYIQRELNQRKIKQANKQKEKGLEL